MIEAVKTIKEFIESLGYEIRHHIPSVELQQKNKTVFAIGFESPTATLMDMCGNSTVTFICTIDVIAPQRDETDNWFNTAQRDISNIAKSLSELTAKGIYKNIMAIPSYEQRTLGVDNAMRSAYQLRLKVICQA